MPLHLLGKKSWNVYNTVNVDRVRRDEADAQAREEAEEQRMQDEDAATRIAILRGEPAAPLPDSAPVGDADSRANTRVPRSREAGTDGKRERKRRKLRGEDDTDADIRFAREDVEAGQKAKTALAKKDTDDAPLVDHAGHLQLIPAPDEKAIRKAGKNAEVEAEKAKKRKREEDQYMMKFSNAAGYSNGMEKPWYASNKLAKQEKDAASTAVALSDVQEKDAWGNEDPRRKNREQNRISSSDPFAAMQHAQRQLKQSSVDKERWQRERAAELEELKKTEDRRRRREKHQERHHDVNKLEGFSLDAPPNRERSEHGRHHGHRHRHHSKERLSGEHSERRARRHQDKQPVSKELYLNCELIREWLQRSPPKIASMSMSQEDGPSIMVMPLAILGKALEEGYDPVKHDAPQKLQVSVDTIPATHHLEAWWLAKERTLPPSLRLEGFTMIFTRPVFSHDPANYDTHAAEAIKELIEHGANLYVDRLRMDIVHVGDVLCTDGEVRGKWLVDNRPAYAIEEDEVDTYGADDITAPFSTQPNNERAAYLYIMIEKEMEEEVNEEGDAGEVKEEHTNEAAESDDLISRRLE
ncbi:hypothetical protein LTR97_002524 [Elasticomyces elasticus]|uniref:CBF1-interacting co-repressor CIR N-terminal domain-containing protein n=1 Tax=Elasticomyces elasticus TaxID=574655 RepID=A0AAN7VWA8_9PEZI|nr:hypothetical protein LTR97_002524 [Elasticomyces elasticus]